MITKVKWAATVAVIFGTSLNSLGLYPYGPMVLVVAGILWLIVSIHWKDKAMIITNGTLTIVSVTGLIATFVATWFFPVALW